MKKRSLEARFRAKVEVGGPDDCWVWRGALNDKPGLGYGVLSRDGDLVLAHRLSWELANGREVPAGMLVLHRCDNPPCVNPRHLYVGTYRENLLDAVRAGRLPDWREPRPAAPAPKERGAAVMGPHPRRDPPTRRIPGSAPVARSQVPERVRAALSGPDVPPFPASGVAQRSCAYPASSSTTVPASRSVRDRRSAQMQQRSSESIRFVFIGPELGPGMGCDASHLGRVETRHEGISPRGLASAKLFHVPIPPVERRGIPGASGPDS